MGGKPHYNKEILPALTPLEKATDEVGGVYLEADPVRDKSLNGIRGRSSLTGLTVCHNKRLCG